MKKDASKIPYQITRICCSPLFKIAYQPTIINKEYIPQKGPVILCGNHLHVWDQFPVICATNRTTHWMAKKEYFDSKLGPFFKATGAISVDRFGDASLSTQKAMDYLNIDSVIGLFAEGTRNGLKESKIRELYDKYIITISYDEFKNKIQKANPLASQINLLEKLYKEDKISSFRFIESMYNPYINLNYMIEDKTITTEEFDNSLLLPFKYGAVSMAAKSGALIVPFAVNGDYKIGSHNLVVRFDEPFSCNENTLEEDNKKLRNKVLSLEKKNIEKISKI